jgi:hypothetical protein
LARKLLVLLWAILLFPFLSQFANAEGTRTWEQSKFDDLTKGTANGVALRSGGGLELAPAFRTLSTTPSTYIWSIASDSAGNIYAAAGSPARVYRITPDGQGTAIFEPQELQVQSLVVDKNNVIYAATAPDGKIYRIVPNRMAPTLPGAGIKAAVPSYSATPYFDPGTKYIWDIVLDNAGNMYVATGDHGEIYKISVNGQHSLFFKSDEVHIRALAVDPKGNLIAGSDGSGLVYRIMPNGDAFVLYSAPKKEITALAIDTAGNIYAAGAGEKRAGAPSGATTMIAAAQSSQSSGGASGSSTSAAPTSPFPAPAQGASGGSEIYRIAPDGSPTRMWSSHDDLVYALGFDRGRLLAGTGNRGHIFAINGVDDFTDLVKASASQITAFAPAPGGGLYVSSSNLGKLFLLVPGPESDGTYESDVFDAHIFSRWGRASMRWAGNVELFARSGNVDNPDRNWSPWTRIDLAGMSQLSVPSARFMQWKSVLHAGAPAPRVDSVLIYYLPKNVAPEIDDVTVQTGYRYPSLPRGASGGETPATIRDRESIAIKWTVHDDDDDTLVYSIYYRGDNETRWLLLKDNLSDKYYSFDSSLLPDGGYTVRIVASDAPSHSPGDAMYAERESSRFEVDTTPPVIENLNAALDGGRIHVQFRARDSFSPIKRAEYSLDGGDWQYVEPVGQVSDSRTEDYDFRMLVPTGQTNPPLIGGPPGNDHVIVVRAYDRFDNMATAKALIRGK